MTDPWGDVRGFINGEYPELIANAADLQRLLTDADALLAVVRAAFYTFEASSDEELRIALDAMELRVAALPEHLREGL